jgi:two-component system, cell cycle sensor histidine kinase and response regulator CckA
MGTLESSKPVIMIVDDEANIIDILVESLKDDYDISVATDGESALQAIVDNPPDLILLDIIMPGIDGYEVCRRLKTDQKTRRIPVIFVTVMDEVVDEARGFELGAVDYIAKHVSPHIVRARVKTHLELELGRKALEKLNMELRETKKRELKDSEARYRALFEGAAEGILIMETLTRRFKYANPAACQLLGYTEDELRLTDFRDIHPDEALEQVVSEFEATEREGKSMTQHDMPFLTKYGTIIYADVVTTPGILMDRVSCCATFLIDMTERKKAEDEKKKMEEQLWQSQKMEAIGRLSGGVAHDFNNMLTTIIGNSEMALAGIEKDDPSREMIEDIKLAGEKAAMLTRQLLAFSRKQVLQPEIFNLNSVVSEMDKMLRRLIGEDIDLETKLFPDLGMVETDPGQVEQIIMNLAVNARDAMPEGGRLTIETANVELDEEYASSHFPAIPGSYEMLSVSDTGVGMSKDILAKIFEPFYTTKEKSKGTGLGLSIVYGIVKQSNGYIWVYSELGKGTTFKIYFPKVEKSEYGEKDIKKSVKEICNGSETILVVEDDAAIMKVIFKLLISCGYTVLCAADGNEALRVSDEHEGPIHLILTDVIMPGMGGKQLAKLLIERRPETEILYMSGYTDDAIVRHGVLEKGLFFIQKPFTSNNLKKKIRETLDRE